MKLGFVSAIFPDLSLGEVLSYASSIGASCVEVMCWPKGKAERRYAGVTHIDCAHLPASEIERIGNLCASAKVSISGLGYYPNALSPDEEEAKTAVEQLHRVFEAAQRLRIGVVNTFIGRDYRLSVEDNMPRLLDTWRPLLAGAAARGLKVGIENCPMLFTRDEWPGGKNIFTTPAIWDRLFGELGPTLGLNFDPSHFIWQQMDYLSAIRRYGKRFWHAHAKDARIDRHKLAEAGILAHPLEFHTPKLPGLGDVDWGQFFSALTETGYQGAVCVEVEDRAYEGSLEARKASVVQSLRYLRQFCEEY
jgi:sugar phosphate isomerase/epimerase